MSRNPLEILFGPEVLVRLRKKPDAILRIANTIKARLMAEAQTGDETQDLGGTTATEVSEAFTILNNASKEELDEFIEAFRSKSRGTNESLKLKLRDANAEIAKLKLRAATPPDNSHLVAKKPISSQYPKPSPAVEILQQTMWNWILASVGEVPVQKIPRLVRRSALHHVRLVVKYQDGFRGFEFDFAGRIRRTICTYTRHEAKTVMLMTGDTERRGVFVTNRFNRDILIGSASVSPKDIANAIATGGVNPIVELGKTPVFVSGFMMTRPFELVETNLVGGEIVDIIPIRRARNKLKSIPKPPTDRQRMIKRHIRAERLRRQVLEKEKRKEEKETTKE